MYAYAGGNNAGHTVINEGGTFSLHLVPSGVFRPQVSCLIGNGVVVDPDVLLEELSELQSRGVDTSRVFLSERAHLIMPYHVLLDQLEEASRGEKALGTTGKGVGPGIRGQDRSHRYSSGRAPGPGGFTGPG